MKKINYKLLAEEVLEKASSKGADFSDVVIIGNVSSLNLWFGSSGYKST